MYGYTIRWKERDLICAGINFKKTGTAFHTHEQVVRTGLNDTVSNETGNQVKSFFVAGIKTFVSTYIKFTGRKPVYTSYTFAIKYGKIKVCMFTICRFCLIPYKDTFICTRHVLSFDQ